jgi:amidase
MSSLNYRTAREMLADLVAKRISARELLDAHVARNDALAAKLNAVVATDLARARKDAQAIDDARTKGESLGTLAGLPMTIKDGTDVENMPATSGNPALADRPKDCADADVVNSVRCEGAIVWGKTNVPLMLGDFQSYNDIYGTTNNPYDQTRVPGGSSGGAAAALAAGITPLEIGSDIGGSLRHPANFCGVLALKPSWGAVSLRGQVPPLPGNYVDLDLGVTGPMARNVGDLRLLWNVLRGSAGAAPRDIKGSKVAVWDDEPGFPLGSDVREAVKRAADAFANAGAVVERAKLPVGGDELMDTYYAILIAVLGATFPKELYDSFSVQHAQDVEATRAGTDTFGAALYRLRATASYRDVLAAMTKRQAMKDKLASFYASGWDMILSPISPVPAFPHDHSQPQMARTLEMDGAKIPYMTMLCWIALATTLHGPALAIPAGRTKSGLPVGVQLIGPQHGEDRLFDFAYALEEMLGGFTPPAI